METTLALQSSKRWAGKLVHDGGGEDDDAGDDEEEVVVQENLGSPILQEVSWDEPGSWFTVVGKLLSTQILHNHLFQKMSLNN